MRYLIVDPLGPYAARLMAFLDRLRLEGVAVFSTPMRRAGWEGKWAHRLGEHVVGTHLANEETDLDELARELDRESPDGFAGIIPWDEISILLGADLSDRLDLGWNSRKVIERCRDKYVMKSWLREHAPNVRINRSRIVAKREEAFAFQEELGTWPVVVKPTGGSGATDVYFAEDRDELLAGCQKVLEGGRGKVLLEEFVAGDEFAVNGMVDAEGSFLVTDIWYYDRRESHGIPNLYYQSIKLSTHEEPFEELADYAASVVAALELRRAPVHMEVKVDETGPCLIEVGARFAGGDQPVLSSKLHGRSLFELAACHYLADLPLSPGDVRYERYDRYEARIVSGIQPVEIERIQAVHGVRQVERLASFEGFGVLRPPGTRLPQTTDLDTKSYEIYLFHPDPLQIELDARAIRELIRYE